MHIQSRKLQRLKEWNYSRPGYYFITIVCGHRDPVFGKINHGKMNLNDFGTIANQCWKNLLQHFSDCALDEFIIMPDHFHGIIELKNGMDVGVGNRHAIDVGNRHAIDVGNRHACSLRQSQRRQYQRIPVIVGAFKSATSRLIHQCGYPEFKWQKSYYDRIIRRNELPRIRKYIRNNPENYKPEE